VLKLNAAQRLLAESLHSPDDSDHEEMLEKTGYWGKRGAGCLPVAQDTGRILFPHRSRNVLEPNTWGSWGGAIDGGENPEVAVRRELREEAGYKGKLRLRPMLVFKDADKGFQYHNFAALVPKEFTPKLNWETQGFRWVEFGDWPSPLHPGVKTLLADSLSLQILRSFTQTR